uniref:Uncharacterized protein n=1 Tax=Globisporangium ultimum (strain ATCC 200006 / CBS 805.95 / DAOM BR144) TaxID=431595 RepID=K3WU93_GLOUD
MRLRCGTLYGRRAGCGWLARSAIPSQAPLEGEPCIIIFGFVRYTRPIANSNGPARVFIT